MKKKLYAILSSFLIISMLTATMCAGAFEVTVQNAILVETKTDTILFQKNASDPISPDEATKLMTAIIAIEYSSPSDVVTISQNAANYVSDNTYVPLYEGEQLTVTDLLYCLILDRSDSAAIALMEHISDSEESYCKLMNEKANYIGAVNTNFVNVTGADAEEQTTTAWDLYVIADYFSQNTRLAEIAATVNYTLPESAWRNNKKKFYNDNYLMTSFKKSGYAYRYAGGLIGGGTDANGGLLVAAASGRRTSPAFIFVGNGKSSPDMSVFSVYSDAKAVFSEAFDTYQIKNVMKKGTILTEAPLNDSFFKDYISLVAKEDIDAVVPKNASNDDIIIKTTPLENIKAPIYKGDDLGRYDVYYKDSLIATGTLTTDEKVSGNIFLKIFTSPLVRVILAALVIFVIVYIILTIRVNNKRKQKPNQNRLPDGSGKKR